MGRLQGAIELTYRIAMPSAAAANDIAKAIEETPQDTLAETIQAKLPANSVCEVQVLSVSASAIVVTITTTSTTRPEGELDDSHARTSAALGSVVATAVL